MAVILSAQCTDKRVNIVTRVLFEKYPYVQDMANATAEEVFEIIRSVSYPNSKSNYLVKTAKLIVENHQGEIPSSIEELVKFPGVGRKTANVIVSVVFNKPAMAVDTHVFRVSKRLGLTAQNLSTPLAVEKDLVKNLPNEVIAVAHHWLILHGRYVCVARTPKCEQCELTHFCKFFEKKSKEKNKITLPSKQ
jgi:endonuclease-3